ncbi:MAG: MFS transporter [Deltaproteobacteria bacterium]|nr:MFS transporter [Deltaproteobacteria bacterium]
MPHSLRHHLRRAPAAPLRPAGAARDDDFRRWQVRVMGGMMFGYALFYIVRKNISMALPGMSEELGYSNTQLGVLLTGTSLVYGVGKFLNGVIADHANPRWFMVIGLLASALINVLFGLSGAFWALLGLWLLNGWAQSMGWPPCATLLTTWYEPKRLATWWGLWNASHQVGGAVIFVLGGYLVTQWGWRAVFFAPAALAAAGAVGVALALRDRPEALGFPSPHGDDAPAPPPRADAPGGWLGALRDTAAHVLANPLLWLVSLGNLCVYVVRIGMLDWAPKFLKEARGVDLSEAGWMVAALEVAGILGGLGAGYLADRAFRGRYSVVNGLYMAGLALSLCLLYLSPALGPAFNTPIASALLLSLVGFLVYGPQMLTSVSAASCAPRAYAGAATGFNGLFGYLGAALSGVGTGVCVDAFGWDGGVAFYLVAALLGVGVFGVAHALQARREAEGGGGATPA